MWFPKAKREFNDWYLAPPELSDLVAGQIGDTALDIRLLMI